MHHETEVFAWIIVAIGVTLFFFVAELGGLVIFLGVMAVSWARGNRPRSG